MSKNLSRRKWIAGGIAGAAGVSGLAVAARVAKSYGLIPPDGSGVYGPGATLTYAAHRLVTSHSLAREFSRDKISKKPYSNGGAPNIEELKKHSAAGFVDWRLEVDGLVAKPRSFSIAELKALPKRSQITQLTCEEGWSYIAEWIGAPLSDILNAVGTRPEAKFVICHTIQKEGFWTSIDMGQALHPQTLIAYGFNGGELRPEFGGPLRLRIPGELGYKSAKYMTRMTVTDSLSGVGKGLGSSDCEWGYSWYAGI